MGMNQQTAQMFQQGLGFVQDLQEMSGGMTTDKAKASAQAGLVEVQARSDAWDSQQDAAGKAQEIREAREQERGKENTSWGGANLTMSGSKKLIRDARRIKDRQAEEDALFDGDLEAETLLEQGQQRANALRINSGGAPERSILSLGSKIYGARS
ncbi:hypothetical protein [Pseudodesulfovibrio sediminis]|uniref:Uncharacterized protein n=1 Tax=Pseudodesulfovibrio sediminis TaxID=2810563 RepID=A0ABN6EUQ2_9BACT|nr:hypothetical protein [Pseudodesulfovibrio sediminis]BCS88866.1 hypothetical protein PSDVSF_21080 [Pseudodesulfovibrio sediminis]